MKILLLGSSGMLGQALSEEGKKRNLEILGVDVVNAPIIMDITNINELTNLIEQEKPDVLINTVAITSLERCENDPGMAYMINARPVATMAKVCRKVGIYFVHISTDHFYTGDAKLKHKEDYPVELINEYARTKYAAERFALTCPHALIVRTNIVGFKNDNSQQTFVEWIFQSMEESFPMVMFEDFFVSSITVSQFSRYLFDLLSERPYGTINLSSRDVFSKQDFIKTIAKKAGYSINQAKAGSVKGLQPRRAESLGLDVKRAEEILDQRMPSLDEVVEEIIYEYGRKNTDVKNDPVY